MELIFNARQPSRCPELPAGHGNYAYWQKSTASSSEQRRNPCLQDGKALEGLQARPDPVYEPMSVSLIFRLGQKESRWTPQPESSGIRFYRIHHKCNAQQYHQKFSHTFFSHLTYFSAPIIQIGLDGMVVHPTQAAKKEHGILILNVPCSFCPLFQHFFYIKVNPSFQHTLFCSGNSAIAINTHNSFLSVSKMPFVILALPIC